MTIHFGVGFDTARYGHHVSFLNEAKNIAAKPFHFTESAEGYDRLRKALQGLRAKGPEVHLHVRVDAAGRYADNLITWLRRHEPAATISLGTPAKNKAYREAHHDKRKGDPEESLACARFAIVERPPAVVVVPEAWRSLCAAVAAMEAQAKTRARLINQLHALLAKYPVAPRVAAARIESLRKIPHMTEETAQALHRLARVSVASATDDVTEELIRHKVAELMASTRLSATLLKLVKKAWDSLPPGPHRRIHTIPGIGLQTAAALVAKIVSIDRFPTAANLVGYFGVFPTQADSGTERNGRPKHAAGGHMCPKGNDLVRRLLYTAAQCAAKHNPQVQSLYARQRAIGKHHDAAIGHGMAKLLRQVFILWRKDVDYDPRHGLPIAAEEATKKVVGLTVDAPPNMPEVTTTASNVAPPPTAGKRPPLNYKLLKNQIAIREVLAATKWTPRTQRGQQLRGPCPFHGGDALERRFAAHVGKNTFHCHHCQCHGNVLDLLTLLSGTPLHEACWTWIERNHLTPPLLDAEGSPKGNR